MSLDSASATPEDVAAARRLLSAEAVRDRANRLFDLALMERLDHFRVDLARLDPVADWVQRLIRSEHPTLEVPPHSRWRNFEVGGIDRWGGLAASREWTDALEFGRASIDLAMISVLIDAGAGTRWAYAEAVTGETFTRTEGLAVASLAMFASGIFSSEPFDPLRADARALAGLTAEELADGFQVSQSNPLVGLEGRLGLLNRLGQQLAHRSDVFGTEDGARPGGLLDHLLRRFPDGRVPAQAILATLLDALGPIWPGRWSLAGVPLGDTWIHQKLVTEDATNQLMPIHKLSQWLTYSLIEPLSWAGLEITNLDGLTGLAEYRNGGLLIDGGIYNPVPFDLLEGRADIVIAVDVVGAPTQRSRKRPSSVELMFGASQLMMQSITAMKLKSKRPEILLRPPVSRFRVLDFLKDEAVTGKLTELGFRVGNDTPANLAANITALEPALKELIDLTRE